MRIGSLFSGYGGLEQGVQSVLGGSVAWHSEIDPGACKILAHCYPDVPNLGDITAIDWASVEPVEVLTAGYPCQPFSAAGKRQGTDDARHLWPYAAEALGNLRPEWCVLENVRGHLTLGFDQVLRDLQLLHYEARWIVLRAADVGAPHGRARVFILGRNVGRQLRSRPDRRRGLHRHPGGWGLDAVAAEGCHDGQGSAEPAGDAQDVWRPSGEGQGGRREDSGLACVAAERPEGGRPDRASVADAANEGGASSDRVAVPGDDRCCTETRESLGGVERRDAPTGTCLPSSHPGGEPEGTGRTRARATPRAADGGLSVRRVVGAGRGSVRSGGVHGSVPDVGPDDRGARLPAGCDGSFPGTSRPAADTYRIGGVGAWLRRPGERWGAQSADGGCVGLATDADGDGREGIGRELAVGRDADGCGSAHTVWGKYEPAIRRWERTLGRLAPSPTERGKNGQPRLSPAFVEFLMGLPAGWVTDVPGITRNEALKALGNGVVPQQAAAALRLLLPDVGRAAA